MKKSTSLPLIIISLAVIAVSLIAYVFLRAPSSQPAALAEIELQSTSNPTSGLFKDYPSWTYSNKLKPNQSIMQMLEMMVTSKTYQKQSFDEASQYIDFNGDGLPDFLYFYRWPPLEVSSAYKCYSRGTRGYMVLKNNGDYTFEQAYKCLWASGETVSHFYGDCAALEPPYEDDFYICSVYDSCEFDRSIHPIFFHDYKEWPSGQLKTDDETRNLLDALSTATSPYTTHPDETKQPRYERGSQFVDLDGDSLVDFLFRQSEREISCVIGKNPSYTVTQAFGEYVGSADLINKKFEIM